MFCLSEVEERNYRFEAVACTKPNEGKDYRLVIKENDDRKASDPK